MTVQLNLEPAGRRIVRLVGAVPDDALGRPTPCAGYSVGDLIDHIHSAALAFTAAAVKRPLERAASGDAANLQGDWRSRVGDDVLALAEAWKDPAAWTGMTRAGGVDLPAETAAAVALDELVIHGWDLAKATGLPAAYDGPGTDTVFETVQFFAASGIDGLFGPSVAVPDDAQLFDRILGLAGRDPAWSPPA